MAFTEDEIQAAVEKLVRPSIRRPYDVLGVRDQATSFNDIKESGAGVFLLYRQAPFYCVYLGVQDLLTRIMSEVALVEQLRAAIKAASRTVLPITDLTPLFNAKSALRELASAAVTSATSFRDVSKIPAFQRFSDSTDRFLSTSGEAIKEGGVIVDTPQGARVSIPALVQALEESHQNLVIYVTGLSQALEDYNAVNLPALLSKSVIQGATDVLAGHADALEKLEPNARLESIRQVVLDVIAAKSVVKEFGSFGGATDIYSITGTGAAYSDASHSALPAQVHPSLPGPYNIAPGVNGLELYLNGSYPARTLTAFTNRTLVSGQTWTFDVGGSVPVDVQQGDYIYVEEDSETVSTWVVQTVNATTLTVTGTTTAPAGACLAEVLPPPTASVALPYAFSAQLLGGVNEGSYTTGNGWIIGDGVAPVRPTGNSIPLNNKLRVVVNGVVHEATLTVSADGTLGGVEATPRTAEQVCADVNATLVPFGYQMRPFLAPRRFYGQVDVTPTTGAEAEFSLLGGFGNFGNQGILEDDLINVLEGSQMGLWTVTTVAAQVLTATRVLGGTALSQTSVLIEVGSPLRRLEIVALSPRGAVDDLDTLGIDGTGTAAFFGATTLGFPVGVAVQSRPLLASELAAAINRSTSLVLASTYFTSLEELQGRGNLGNSSLLSLYRFQEVGTTTFLAGVTNTLTVAVEGAESAGVVPGDILVVRTGQYAGGEWDVMTASNTQIVATRAAMLGASETNVTVEVGPLLLSAKAVQVPSGANEGTYAIQPQAGPTALDVYIYPPLSNPTDVVTGLPVVFTAEAGREYLSIASRNTTTASSVKVRGSSSLVFMMTGIPARSVYFQLPQAVRGLEPGDILSFHISDYLVPAMTIPIVAVDGRILTLAEPVDVTPSWDFGAELTPPFARLHAGNVVDFTNFKEGADLWLTAATQRPAYFTELDRRINPILANTTPTAAAIGTAISWLESLLGALTLDGFFAYGGSIVPLEQTLRDYSVARVPAVDALLRAFREKGADRAVDLLVTGHFQDFFGVTPQTSSYAGDFQEKMRQVAMSDLPVTKVDRKEATISKLLISTETPDKDYDLEDVEGEELVPDPV